MLSASLPIDKVEFASPFALVFGNEAHGLPEEFASLGQSVIIPCTDKVDSLNLSIERQGGESVRSRLLKSTFSTALSMALPNLSAIM